MGPASPAHGRFGSRSRPVHPMKRLRIDLASLRTLHPEFRTMNRQVIPSMILSVLIVCFFSVLLYEREKTPGIVAGARAGSKRPGVGPPRPSPAPAPAPPSAPAPPPASEAEGPVMADATSAPVAPDQPPPTEPEKPAASGSGSTHRGEPSPGRPPCQTGQPRRLRCAGGARTRAVDPAARAGTEDRFSRPRREAAAAAVEAAPPSRAPSPSSPLRRRRRLLRHCPRGLRRRHRPVLRALGRRSRR